MGGMQCGVKMEFKGSDYHKVRGWRKRIKIQMGLIMIEWALNRVWS